MSLLPTTTQLEADLASKNELILHSAEATHHLAATLAASNERFWSLPTDRLLAVLNADVPTTLATFAANTALGTAVNATLDTLGSERFSKRAPVVPARSDIVLDAASGQFVYIPTPEPESIMIPQ